MFGRRKRKTPPNPRSAPEQSGVYKRPRFDEDQTRVLDEEQTHTLRILLGDTDLALDEESERGGDPHDNSGRYSVAHLRSRLK